MFLGLFLFKLKTIPASPVSGCSGSSLSRDTLTSLSLFVKFTQSSSSREEAWARTPGAQHGPNRQRRSFFTWADHPRQEPVGSDTWRAAIGDGFTVVIVFTSNISLQIRYEKILLYLFFPDLISPLTTCSYTNQTGKSRPAKSLI